MHSVITFTTCTYFKAGYSIHYILKIKNKFLSFGCHLYLYVHIVISMPPSGHWQTLLYAFLLLCPNEMGPTQCHDRSQQHLETIVVSHCCPRAGCHKTKPPLTGKLPPSSTNCTCPCGDEQLTMSWWQSYIYQTETG